ncbi:MAG: helix-turn-helix domain-containing protein [Acidobacteria bacterium]|nr:helix-turn-helix domain-containing protein [Acidobacteriota bacterium]
MKILIIEPDVDFRSSVAEALTQAGHQVREVADAAAGRDALNDADIRVVVMSHRQTRLGDLDLIQTARSHNANTGVIFCAEKPKVEDVVGLMKRGADDFLTRPVPPSAVVSAVEAVIKHRGLDMSGSHQLSQALGTLLRDLRKERKMSLKHVANRTGLSVSLLSQIELAKTSASIATLHKVACALGTRLGSLFEKV